MAQEENLFPSMGDIASRTDALREVEDDDVRLAEDAPPRVEEEEGEEREIKEVESLCMRCHEQGVTRLLLTSIPYFKEIVISSFRCDHCGHRDSEIQSAGEIQPKGINYTVHMRHYADLDRQIVKSSFATVTIPEVQLTIPQGRGQLTTVEGLIRDTIRDLNMSQPVRRVMDPPTGEKIDAMLATLRDYLGIEEGEEDDDGGVGLNDDEERERKERLAKKTEEKREQEPFKPFSMILDDPSGNSFFQFQGGTNDPHWNMRAYNRTLEQNIELGLVARPEGMPEDKEGAAQPIIPEDHKLKSMADVEKHFNPHLGQGSGSGAASNAPVPDEIFSFPSTCSSCGHELETLMQQVNIPYFQNIVIMATNCFACGYRDNEVKSSGAVSELGKKITLKVEDEEDLGRDVLKSDTAGLEIPEIDLVLQPGTLGGRFTTLEGMLNEIYTELSTKVFRTGDSLTSGIGQQGSNNNLTMEERKFEDFLRGLKECMSASKPFTVIIDDPMSNSYLQNLYAPDPDPNMETVEYKRTHEQDEELGLNDIKLEGYEKDAEQAKATPGTTATT